MTFYGLIDDVSTDISIDQSTSSRSHVVTVLVLDAFVSLLGAKTRTW